MSYVLDGLKTAMVVRGFGYDGREATCPCGAKWVVREGRSVLPHGVVDRASLRFHYTNCPHAKATTHER